MIRNLVFILPFLIWIISGCGTSKKTTTSDTDLIEIDTTEVYEEIVEEFTEEIDTTPKIYRPSVTRYFDLLHTKLEVTPDWQTEQLKGKATLTLKPYFYPDSILILDAKYFDLNSIALFEKGKSKNLLYTYDSLQVYINLGKAYTRKDTFIILIDYVAKPGNIPYDGKLGRNPDQGLYFVNADGSDPNKPMQLWTQGETEFSSAWYPTIDKPNERTTQEVFITVADTLTTLSNGILKSVKQNKDRTKVWHWQLDKPHAPYLSMIAAGDFRITKDKWRDIELGYYLEPAYAPYAMDIFGNTPEMLEFFSDITGVKYPWPVYNQIVVQDFVTGAMENTTASVYSAPIQRTRRELIDDNHEDVIAHEAFHQWFGNYVTTESWANIVLNEAFATYGEYLWFEHKYGKDRADYHLNQDLTRYLSEAQSKQEQLVRYYYTDKEEVFDAHSYQKGGWVLHMLRNYVGDEAFFASLHEYLERNKFQTVELPKLRIAFEEVTGQDLNWFFNQWFLIPGHPVLNIEKGIDSVNNRSFVTISQYNSAGEDVIYRLPVTVDIAKNGRVERKKIILDEATETFNFPGIADYIMVDADKSLLAEIEQSKTIEAYIKQFNYSDNVVHRLEALNAISSQQELLLAEQAMRKALNDSFWAVRKAAIDKIKFDKADQALGKEFTNIALNDKDSRVRAAAVIQLYSSMDSSYLPVMRQAIKDSSYYVQGEGIYGIFILDPKEALKIAPQFEDVDNINIALSLADIYSNLGGPEAQDYFIKRINNTSSWDKYTMITYYGTFLQRMEDMEVVLKGFDALKNVAINDRDWLFRYNAKSTMDRLLEDYHFELSELRINEPNAERTRELEDFIQQVNDMLKEIRSRETNETLINIYKVQE